MEDKYEHVFVFEDADIDSFLNEKKIIDLYKVWPNMKKAEENNSCRLQRIYV